MSKRILIFDDDEGILNIMKYILEEKGWIVATSRSCNNVIEKIRAIVPSVIFMDNNIPDLGGIWATRSIKKEVDLVNIPVIYFSAHADVERLAGEAGADAFLNKPMDLTKLYLLTERMVSPGND